MIQVFPVSFPPSNTPVVDANGAMTIVGMSFWRALWNRTGQLNGLLQQVALNVPGGILGADWNEVNGGDVTLPALTGGQSVLVYNSGIGGVTVSAPAGATIDGSPFYVLVNGKMQVFLYFTATQIQSLQLG